MPSRDDLVAHRTSVASHRCHGSLCHGTAGTWPPHPLALGASHEAWGGDNGVQKGKSRWRGAVVCGKGTWAGGGRQHGAGKGGTRLGGSGQGKGQGEQRNTKKVARTFGDCPVFFAQGGLNLQHTGHVAENRHTQPMEQRQALAGGLLWGPAAGSSPWGRGHIPGEG